MSEIKWTAAQKQAIDAENCSIAVSAAAGSGKTAVLTRRITERICSGKADISRTLIVTFTRAAAAELVSRIGEALSGESAKNPSDRRIARQLLLLPTAKICTIDSFCLDLIRENFTDTGVSGFGVLDTESEKILKKEIMDELVSDCFDGNVSGVNAEEFGAFSDTFGVPTSDARLCETGVRLYDYYSNFINGSDALREKNADSVSDFSETAWGTAIYAFSADLFSHYTELLGNATDIISKTEGAGGWLEGFSKDAEYARFVLGKIKEKVKYAELKRLVSDFDKYRVARLGQVKAEYKTARLEYLKNCRSDFGKAVKALATDYFSCDDGKLSEITEKTMQMQEQMYKFLSEFEGRLSEEKKRRRVMGFSDIERLALKLLYDFENKAPTEAAKEISARFDEIYIDEYQDTNEVQDLIFSLISREDNRFTVGDVKQSIYEFRGAEPLIFTRQTDSREKYREGAGLKQAKLFLSENFRSTEEIIACVNGVFEKLMNARGDEKYGRDERLNCGRENYHGDVPEMYIVCRDAENPEINEENFVAEKIRGIIAEGQVKPGDIAVLVMTKEQTATMEEALSRRGVPCRNAAASEFFGSPEILLALSVLNTVDNPGRDVYLAGALKSRIYGVTLDELIYIRRYKKGGTLFSALKIFTEETGFAKGEKFLSDHEKFRGYAKICSCGELVRRIYSDTQMMSLAVPPESGEAEAAKANLKRLYDYARSFEKNGERGLYAFISFISGLADEGAKTDVSQFSSASDAVNIMTVHGSKGLEFDVCFLCGANHEFYKKESGDDVVASRTLPLAMRLYDGDKKIETPMRNAALCSVLTRKSDEFLRTLYVALTRAKKRLIITGEAKDAAEAERRFNFKNPDSECFCASAYYSKYARRKSRCFLELLCLSLAEKPDACSLEFITEIAPPVTVSEKEKAAYKMTYSEAKKLISEKMNYKYPFAALAGVPSKLSVSKLYPDVLDAEEGIFEIDREPDLNIAEPMFLKTGGGESDAVASDAAEKGTAMHVFMQFFDFDSVERLGVEGEIRRLADNRFIFPEDASKMDAGKLGRFFSSPLAESMRRAKKIFREKRFIVYYPAEEFSEDESTKAALTGEKLLVQGVIDCAFVNEKGELILVDYKTDSFPGDYDAEHIKNILKKRHSRQLGYYKYACSSLFSQPVAHTYIYSFSLDGAIEL